MPGKHKYLIVVGPIPEWMFGLPDKENFQPIKDEIREAVWSPKIMTLHPEPRVNLIRNGLACFDLDDYDRAMVTHDILQGHYWRKEGIMLNAYVWQQDAQGGVQLRGPIESTTGQMLPAPVPLSPPIVPFIHRHPGCMIPTRSHPANSHHDHGYSQHSGTRRRNVSEASSETPAGNAGFGHPLQQQSIHRSMTVSMRPAFSSSSRNSSVSALSTMTIPSSVASIDATHTFSNLSGALGKPHGSRDPSFSNLSIASTTSRSHGPIPVPPPSVSEQGSAHRSSAAVHGYRVTIRNLCPEATKERVYSLVEEKTHAFVQMIQPEYITLRQVHGQLHAYVKFIRKKDAQEAVQQLHGYTFIGRTLKVTLGQD